MDMKEQKEEEQEEEEEGEGVGGGGGEGAGEGGEGGGEGGEGEKARVRSAPFGSDKNHLSFEVPDEYDRLGEDEEHVDEEDGMEVKDQAVEIVAHLKNQQTNFQSGIQQHIFRTTNISFGLTSHSFCPNSYVLMSD